jgi:hypothetical protein
MYKVARDHAIIGHAIAGNLVENLGDGVTG